MPATPFLKSTFEPPYADTRDGALRFFIALMRALRAATRAQALSPALALQQWFAQTPSDRATFNRHLAQLLNDTRHVTLYVEAGILPNSGFFSEIKRRIVQRVLPDVPDEEQLRTAVNLIFSARDDHRWLETSEDEAQRAFWNDIAIALPEATVAHLYNQMLEALQTLALRIGAMGLEPELARILPKLADFESPFQHLSEEALRFAETWRTGDTDPTHDEKHLLVLVAQCRDVLTHARATALTQGTSLPLTYLLERLHQSLNRLEQLAVLLGARLRGERAQPQHYLPLLQSLIRGENHRHNVSDAFHYLSRLLALRIVENAGRTGEHYVTTNHTEYIAMWRSAAGAGILVGVMAMIKILCSHMTLPPLDYAFFYSLNYALGFMLIHVLHFTIATKQPAMTAATLAASIDESGGSTRELGQLATLIIDVLRSQLAAILGNVLLAFPTALIIAFIFGAPLLNADKAQHLLHDLSPVSSLAIFHAAIAGVCLFLSGLVSGYFDNKAMYDRLPARIANLAWLRRLLGPHRTEQLATYLADNLGSLAGNAFFGIMLGSIGTLGVITGLPIDIRHIAFSAANFGFALAALDFHIDAHTLIASLLGIALIGLTNLGVSFTLALWVALRARGVSFAHSRRLARTLWQRLRTTPRDFFLPPRTPPAAEPHD